MESEQEIDETSEELSSCQAGWNNRDFTRQIKEFEHLSKMIHVRLEATDKLLKVVENSIRTHNDLGDPLTLDPDTIGYDRIMELYLKILRSQRELAEQYRKMELTNLEFLDKQNRFELKQTFLKEVEGLSVEEMRKKALDGNFTPTNMIAANMLADGTNNAYVGNRALGSLSGWQQPITAESNVIPSLTINLVGENGEVKQISNNSIDAEFEEVESEND